MNNRDKRRGIAEDTLTILEQGFYLTANRERIEIRRDLESAVEKTKVYRPEASDELLENNRFDTRAKDTEITVSDQTSLEAVRELLSQGYDDVLCLNFASARNAGGGFLGGSQAQEESLARATGLYPCLLEATEYYEVNRKTKSCMYTDFMIYSPNVPLIKDEEGVNLDTASSCAIITAPAVNTGVVKRQEPERIAEIETVMKRRIKKVLAIAAVNKHNTLVLGAWGCGVFQNDPQDIARYFREILDTDFKGCFKKIVFAIYAKNERFIKPFREDFEN